MKPDQEWTQERRDLIDLVDDISSRLRHGEDKGYIVMLLDQASQECADMEQDT